MKDGNFTFVCIIYFFVVTEIHFLQLKNASFIVLLMCYTEIYFMELSIEFNQKSQFQFVKLKKCLQVSMSVAFFENLS